MRVWAPDLEHGSEIYDVDEETTIDTDVRELSLCLEATSSKEERTRGTSMSESGFGETNRRYVKIRRRVGELDERIFFFFWHYGLPSRDLTKDSI